MKFKKIKYIVDNITIYFLYSLAICKMQRPVRLWKMKSNKTVVPIQMSLNPFSSFCSFLHFPHVYLCMWYI